MSFLAREFIKEKRENKEHRKEDIKTFIQSYLEKDVPDYQMSAWLMASFINGLSSSEASALTEVMLNSGYRFNFDNIEGKKIDKHSTGGVGDKASMILAPIAAACGVKVPMIAGRGLGHTGGTLDKLEAISGFSTDLTKEQFIQSVKDINYSIMGQTEEICPADKRIYSMRDVTATIESIPLICASIMSKKLAEGIDGLVLDVKVGSGAFMKTIEQAENLANSLKDIGTDHGCEVRAIITDMNQPLGRHCGNANEIFECAEILQNTKLSHDEFADCRELSILLAAHMISISKGIQTEAAIELATKSIEDGSAWNKFEELVAIQGGNYDIQTPSYDSSVVSESAGYLSSFETEAIGIAGIKLGAGRKVATDKIDHLAGVYLHKKLGDKVEVGEKIFSIFAKDKSRYAEVESMLKNSFSVSTNQEDKLSLVKKILF